MLLYNLTKLHTTVFYFQAYKGLSKKILQLLTKSFSFEKEFKMTIPYAKTCANTLANQGEIPVGKFVYLLPYSTNIPNSYKFIRFIKRDKQATICLENVKGSIPFRPSGRGSCKPLKKRVSRKKNYTLKPSS